MRNLFAAILFVVATGSCQQNSHEAAPQKRNIQLINQYFEHFNGHDWKAMADMYVDSATFKDPSIGTEAVRMSRGEIINKYTELQQMIPDVKDSVIALYPSGDKEVIVEFISTGTGPDNQQFSLPICTIFTLEGGKISRDFTYYDNSGSK